MWHKRSKSLPQNESFVSSAKNMAKCHFCSGYHSIHFKAVQIMPKKNVFLYWYEIECNDDNTAIVDVRCEITQYKLLWFRKENCTSITDIQEFINQIKLNNNYDNLPPREPQSNPLTIKWVCCILSRKNKQKFHPVDDFTICYYYHRIRYGLKFAPLETICNWIFYTSKSCRSKQIQSNNFRIHQ